MTTPNPITASRERMRREISAMMQMPEFDVPWYGDGHYCTHHPDDPSHGPKCYEHPIVPVVQEMLLQHEATVKEEMAREIVGEIGAKLLAKHSPQSILDAYFDAANELLEDNE